MTRRTVHSLGVTFLSGLVLLGAGCSSTPSAGIGTPELRVPATTPVRDREPELTALRAEMAATRIAAAKKEAEVQELRDLVQQLRRENAESRQAFLEMRDRAEQRQVEVEKVREVQDRQAQVYATQDLSVLKETVATLAQELGQLRQDLTKPVAKERVDFLMPSLSKSSDRGRRAQRPDPSQLVPEGRLHTSPIAAQPPMALTMTAAVPDSLSTITVQAGDTLASLAKRHRTTVEVLRRVNGLNGDALIVGRELILPPFPQP